VPRRELPLDPSAGPLEAFAFELRQLRYVAGNPPYRQLARKAFRSAAALSAAASGKSFPSLEVTLAYVRACGGDDHEWRARWLELNAQLMSARVSEGDKSPRALEQHQFGAEPLAEGDPTMIGPFRLAGRLGAGTMGQVYLGRTPGQRAVAVKIIRPELADDPLFRRRFRREVEAARSVHGLYIAPLVDADPDATRPWLATAYIVGPTLRDAVVDHGVLPAESVLRLGAGIAEALQAIHAAGVIHRDLKPGNVLLAEDGPRVIDFGIAYAIDETQLTLTYTGTRVGTPGFTAPEVILGQRAGSAADVFALGAVLAYAATGHTPFGEGSAEAVLYRLVHQPVNLGAVPMELREIVEVCLNKDPAQRPAPAAIIRRCQLAIHQPNWDTQWLPQPVAAEIDSRIEAARFEPRHPSRLPNLKLLAMVAIIAVAALIAGFLLGNRNGHNTGGLRVGRDTVPLAVDLSRLGVIDWVHWGHLDSDGDNPEGFVVQPVDVGCKHNVHCSNRKSGAYKISEYSPVGSVTPFRQRDLQAPLAFSWRDGEPTLAAHNVRSTCGFTGTGSGSLFPLTEHHAHSPSMSVSTKERRSAWPPSAMVVLPRLRTALSIRLGRPTQVSPHTSSTTKPVPTHSP
jgi:serine/threonine protein kinase